MNWFILTLVFHVLRLNLCVALSQVCSDQQFLSAGVCVNCTVCKQPGKNVVLRSCSAHEDTICGSVSDIHINLAGIEKLQFKNDITNLPKGNVIATSADKGSTTLDFKDYDEDSNEEDGLNFEYEDDSTSPKPNQTTSKDHTNEQLKEISIDDKWMSKSNEERSQFNTDEVTVMDPDTLFKKIKKLKKFELKEINTNVEINDHLLKIADTQFKVGNEKIDDERHWEPHPNYVDEKKVDSKDKNRKGSTFFSSGEKQTDQEYANEMAKLLNETSSVLDKNNLPVLNSTEQNKTNANVDDYDFNELKILDDDDSDDDDSDDDEDDEDEDDDEDGVSDDDESLIFNNIGSSNSSDKNDSAETLDYDTDDDNDYGFDVEKPDFDKEEENDLQENDLYEDKPYMHLPGVSSNDVIAEPFVSTANWQILILVAAMSACLLFFIVISAYICIYMRKRSYYKTTFVPDVEDLSSRVNLIQHATLEANDSGNIRDYTSHLRCVKSNNEKLPKMY